MTPHPERSLVWLLLVVAGALALGRVLTVERVNEPSVHKTDGDATTPRPAWPKSRPTPSPTFGSNDRSRWAAVRALVEHGTFVIGQRSMKTTLLSAVTPLAAPDPLGAAGLTAVGYMARIGSDSGLIFEDGYQSVDKILNPTTLEYYSTKPPLLTVLAAGSYFLLREGFGLEMSSEPFLVVRLILVVFNVLPFVLSLWLLADTVRRLGAGEEAVAFIVVTGAFAGMNWPFLVTFNNHTPAVAACTLALWAAVRIELTPVPSGWFYVLAGLGTGFVAACELPGMALVAGLGAYLMMRDARATFLLYAPCAALPLIALLTTNYIELGRFSPAYSDFGTEWYEFEGSHWRVPAGFKKRGIDFATEDKATYAFHLLLGHHGWFSLMPVLFLSIPGFFAGRWRALGWATLILSAVVMSFYVVKSNNYGGWSNGPRWLMWLTPLWLACMVPAVERLLRSTWGRCFAVGLLIISMAAMNYQAWSPWRHPWIYVWMEWRGWPGY